MSGRWDTLSSLKPKCKYLSWSDVEIHKLVYLYKMFPCLWRNDISLYNDNVARHLAYRNIHQALSKPDLTFTGVIMKIREIRHEYINDLKNALTAKSSGHFYQPRSTWITFLHQFLFPYLDTNELVELHNIDHHSAHSGSDNDCQSVSETVIRGNTKALKNIEARHYCSSHQDRSLMEDFSMTFPELCLPGNSCMVVNDHSLDWFHPVESDLCYEQTTTPGLNSSADLPSYGFKYRPLPLTSLPLSTCYQPYDFYSVNIASGSSKLGKRYSKSENSVSSEKSSTTIVCERRSDSTCTPTKSVVECGVQWENVDTEKNSWAVSCTTCPFKRQTKDSSIAVEHDAYDRFAETIACHLRAMDVETAMQAQNQIHKIVTDYRLRKPETISLGGDTDTIGSMAGAVAGAFYGEELVKPEVLRHCENSTEFKNLADKLFDLSST